MVLSASSSPEQLSNAAYDTVQHRVMIRKPLDMTGDLNLCQVIKSLLHNRCFFVQLNDKKSKWKAQKNGLPQGSVLAPLLFNIYTNVSVDCFSSLFDQCGNRITECAVDKMIITFGEVDYIAIALVDNYV